MQWVLNPDASAFYEAAGSAAAALGVTVSVFAASARTCGLNAIQALVDQSGGCLRLYPALQQAAMPQVRFCSSCLILGTHKGRMAAHVHIAYVSLCNCIVWLELCCRGLALVLMIVKVHGARGCDHFITSLHAYSSRVDLEWSSLQRLTSLICHHSRRVPFYALRVMSVLQLVSTMAIRPKATTFFQSSARPQTSKGFSACAHGLPL